MCEWNISSERFDACDGISRCYCIAEPEWDDDFYGEEEQMCSKEDNEYYNRDGYDPEPSAAGIFICDNCKEPDEVCKCPWCRWCGAGVEENVKLNKIKCPLDKCDGIGDEVCIECKNKHDRGHGL